MPDEAPRPRVGIVMGSDSDWPVMSAAGVALQEFGVAFEADVVSAHRMADAMIAYGRTAHGRGLEVIIAGAGGAAHLPGMLAAVTPLPVIGVPVPLKYLDGMDSLLSIVQMPAVCRWQPSPSATPATPDCWRYASWRPAILSCGSRCLISKINFGRRQRPRAPPYGQTRRTRAVGSASLTR